MHQRFEKTDQRHFAIEQRVPHGDSSLTGESSDDISGTRQVQKVALLAPYKKQLDMTLVIHQRQRVEGDSRWLRTGRHQQEDRKEQ